MATRRNETAKFSDTQLVLLSAASQRQNRIVQRGNEMTDRAFARALNGLAKLGLVAELGSDQQGSDEVGNERDRGTFVITSAGFSAIQVAEPEEAACIGSSSGGTDKRPLSVGRYKEGAVQRPTKRAHIIALLSRASGATLDDLMAVTGWLPHTTRAALTGLRQKGYCIERTQAEDRTSIYRLLAEATHRTAA